MTVALKDKIDILKKIDSGKNMCKLAKAYGVGRTTQHDIKKKIVEHVKTMESGSGKRQTFRVNDDPKSSENNINLIIRTLKFI